MKAYKVLKGYNKDHYGYTDLNSENALYFFNKEDALAEYKKGEFIHEYTAIYTTYANGKVSKATTGRQFYQRRLETKEEYETVVLETEVMNAYKLTEIEIN